ncbi:MAG: trypsin-like serine protease, partial [Bdellovibrionales bacterium]|nr:trypsin-like serine protease [Bdellovibrionales bacterium]
ILTTAHCVSDATRIKITFDVENGASARQTQLLGPDSWIQHPKYDPKKSLYEFDLARIRLKEAAPLSSKSIRHIPNSIVLAPGVRVQRIGVGLRNGINSRNFTDPKFLSVVGNTSLETEDSFSAPGDSGGPVYTASFQLIGIHSTLDDRDHKEAKRGYGPYLPAYRKWIFSK